MTAESPVTTGERLTSGPAPALLRAALDAASEAVLLCDSADDTILMVNAAAQALVPAFAAGGSPFDGPLPGLAGALAAGDDSFTDVHAGRHLQGQRRALGADHYGWYLRDRTDEVARADALRAERARTAFLAEAGRRLSSSLHQGRCQRITAELAVAHLADAAMVVLPMNRRQAQWVRLVAGGSPEEGTLREQSLNQVPGLIEALGGFPPIPSKWLDPAQAPEWLFPANFGPIGALLVTPLPGNAEPAGALILARRGDNAQFGPEDEILARIFAARAGAAISAALLYREQVDTTAVLQADLLPPDLIQPDGIELVGSYQAAREAMRIGGDFYDVFGPTDNSPDTVIALGDVCGKGPEAAVLTGKVRQTLRALRLVDAPPEEMLRVLNKALLDSGRQHRFVTLVVGSVNRVEHGRVQLRLATGGHPAPLVLRADGRVEEVPVSGTLIGAVARTVVNPADIELAPGELCLLYSDGLTEARGGPADGEQFGEARLHDALAECRGLPAVATVERIRQLVSDWVHGGVRDDIAMLAVRAPARTQLSLRNGSRNASPFAIDARRTERRVRARS
ncbi:PP2C family protein-serine/threonine phosphatase [Paractinoplanes lichenicola]|uniref:Serine/threonine-protein phosphatase n=1 Tax=Paractinoplanes lichenicola TaxID=2802976 RepID=A0ABS1VVA0_9ACTN|nr:PP2C family protein-serine/threonine phosphatase [Actinoplanes lichenicola]MBL7258409.1 serine/threonine-protein phosphatase [Actinoplanes lichenicola]